MCYELGCDKDAAARIWRRAGGERAGNTAPGGTEYQTRLQQDARLLLFSDGAPNATNRRDEAYGYKRLLAACADYQTLIAEAFVDAIVHNIDLWTGCAEPFDDLTLLAVEVGGSSERSA